MTISTVTPITEIPKRSEAVSEDAYSAAVETLMEQTLPGLTQELAVSIPQLNTDIALVNTQAVQVADDTELAGQYAGIAEQSYESAIAGDFGPLSGASTTSMAITGALTTRTFTANAGKNWWIGQAVDVRSSASPLNAMIGEVTAYNRTTGAMTILVLEAQGSGTFADWLILPAGSRTARLPHWTQIGQPVSAAGASSIVLTGFPDIYGDLLIHAQGISTAVTQNAQFSLSENGVNYTNSLNYLDGTASAINSEYGAITICNYRASSGIGQSVALDLAGQATRYIGFGGDNFVWRCGGPVTHIRMSLGSTTFDAGTFTVYAR